MKKAVLSVIAVCALVASVYAGPTAILSGLKGKVEVKPAQGTWAPATEGMTIGLSSTISTGYDSTATLVIDKSTIVVKPLTRLTLDKLLEKSAGSISASTYLRVGSIQAKVKASVPGTPQDFKVQSPYSTASVRGTEFVFNGLRLTVLDGTVRLTPGRPTRDIQPAEEALQAAEAPIAAAGLGTAVETGFEGATEVEAANDSAAVDVKKNQQAVVAIPHALDTGASVSAPTQAATSANGTVVTTNSAGYPAAPSSANPNASTKKSGGVTITITSN
jgi:hypothetical protein